MERAIARSLGSSGMPTRHPPICSLRFVLPPGLDEIVIKDVISHGSRDNQPSEKVGRDQVPPTETDSRTKNRSTVAKEGRELGWGGGGDLQRRNTHKKIEDGGTKIKRPDSCAPFSGLEIQILGQVWALEWGGAALLLLGGKVLRGKAGSVLRGTERQL